MSKNSTPTWNTKYGRRRVRDEAPTLEEAIAAARDLTDDASAQAEIAASLIGTSIEQVRTALATMAAPRKDRTRTFTFAGPPSAPRTVVVERKPSRRVTAAPSRAGRAAWTSAHNPAMAPSR